MNHDDTTVNTEEQHHHLLNQESEGAGETKFSGGGGSGGGGSVSRNTTTAMLTNSSLLQQRQDDDGSGDVEVADNCRLYFPSDHQHDTSWYDTSAAVGGNNGASRQQRLQQIACTLSAMSDTSIPHSLLEAESTLSTMYAQHVVLDVLSAWLRASDNPALDATQVGPLPMASSTSSIRHLLRFAKLGFMQSERKLHPKSFENTAASQQQEEHEQKQNQNHHEQQQKPKQSQQSPTKASAGASNDSTSAQRIGGGIPPTVEEMGTPRVQTLIKSG